MMIQRSLVFLFLFVIASLSDVGAMVTTSSRRTFLNQVEVTGAFILGLTPATAEAYERRDVGSEGSRSASTYAFNEQAFKTNNRLEAEGLKLDTLEEEKAKLTAAMASFSYESSTSTKKKTGYRSNASKSAIPSKIN